VLDPGAPPSPAPGTWVIWSGDLPEALTGLVQSSGDRSEGLPLSPGIVGLSTVWAGMNVLPPTP